MATRKVAARAVETAVSTAAKAETREPKKEASKKAPAKKAAEVKSTMYVQFAGKQFTEKELVAAAKKAYMGLGHKAAEIVTLELYVKPEESVAYYVVNGEGADEYKIEL